MKSSITFASNGVRAAALILALVIIEFPAHAAADKLDRTILPIPEPKRVPITELDVRNAKAPPRFEVKAPKGAPNVVIVLLDDLGFAHPAAQQCQTERADTQPEVDRKSTRLNSSHMVQSRMPSSA